MVLVLNKKEAIAYAQITLDYMQSSKYKGTLNVESFGMEMKECFKLYPRNAVISIAKGKVYAESKLETIKSEIIKQNDTTIE